MEHELAQLPERQRAALWLTAVEGLSYAEVAEALEISESAVKALVHRARTALAERIGDGEQSQWPSAATGCREFEADLSALLDGELAPERAAELRAHVAACDGCRGRLARLARVDAALAGAPAPAVPASLRARLEARLEGARPADTQVRRAPRAGAPRRAWRGRAAGARRRPPPGWRSTSPSRPASRRGRSRRPRADRAPRRGPREAPSRCAAPAPVRPRRARAAPAAPPLDLESVPEEDLDLALELDTVEDLDVIANLELLELVLESEAG